MKPTLFALWVLLSFPVAAEVLRVDYTGGFTVWLDCEKRGAVKFQYNAQRDTGDAKRSSRFYLDPKVPARCLRSRLRAQMQRHDQRRAS